MGLRPVVQMPAQRTNPDPAVLESRAIFSACSPWHYRKTSRTRPDATCNAPSNQRTRDVPSPPPCPAATQPHQPGDADHHRPARRYRPCRDSPAGSAVRRLHRQRVRLGVEGGGAGTGVHPGDVVHRQPPARPADPHSPDPVDVPDRHLQRRPGRGGGQLRLPVVAGTEQPGRRADAPPAASARCSRRC